MVCCGLLPARCCLLSPAQGGASLGAGMCQLPWQAHSVMREGKPDQAAARIHSPPIPSPPPALAQTLLCPRAELCFPLTALIPPTDFQGTELRLCSAWPWKAKSDTKSLSSLFIICSGLEPKPASLVLENPNSFPLHCVHLRRNKDN